MKERIAQRKLRDELGAKSTKTVAQIEENEQIKSSINDVLKLMGKKV